MHPCTVIVIKLQQEAATLRASVSKIEMLTIRWIHRQPASANCVVIRRHDVRAYFRNACFRTKNNPFSPPNVSINAVKQEITRDAKTMAPSAHRNYAYRRKKCATSSICHIIGAEVQNYRDFYVTQERMRQRNQGSRVLGSKTPQQEDIPPSGGTNSDPENSLRQSQPHTTAVVVIVQIARHITDPHETEWPNLLEYLWRNEIKYLKHVIKPEKKYLLIPATSVSCHRAPSKSGLLLSE